MKFSEQIERIVGLIDAKKSLPEIKEAVLALHEHAEAHDHDLEDALATRDQALADKDSIYEKYSELQRKQAALQHSQKKLSPDGFDETTEKIIDLFFDESEEWSAEAIAERLQLQTNVAKFHMEMLQKVRFILPGPMQIVVHRSARRPATYRLGPAGRAHVMQKRSPTNPSSQPR